MHQRQTLATKAHARFAAAEFIEVLVHRRRPHSTLGYRTSSEALNDYQTTAAAA